MTNTTANVTTWEYKKFQLLSISQPTAVMAVFAFDDPENPGRHELVAIPLIGLAVARVTTYKCVQHGELIPKQTATNEHSAIVGIELHDNMIYICEESSDFAGYMNHGDDITQCTAFLDPVKYRDLCDAARDARKDTP